MHRPQLRLTRRTTATAAASAAVAVGALLVAPTAAAHAAGTTTVTVTAPDTVTPGSSTTFTIEVQNSTGSSVSGHLLIELSGEPPVSASDVTNTSVSANNDTSPTVSAAQPAGAKQVVDLSINPNSVTTYPDGADVTYTVTATLSSAWRGDIEVDGYLDPPSGTPTADEPQDSTFTVVPKATPYPHVQYPVVSRSSNGSLYYASAAKAGGGTPLQVRFGSSSDTRLGLDLFSSGDTLPLVYRPSNSTFYVGGVISQGSGGALGATAVDDEHFGSRGDVPIVVSFSGDGNEGASDVLGVYRPSNASFYLDQQSDGSNEAFPFGSHGDIPLIGNWDGNSDGDFPGVYRPSTATFYLMTEGGVKTVKFGSHGDTPIVGDWNGSGTTLIGVRRGNTVIEASSNGTAPTALASFAFGSASDTVSTSAWSFTTGDLRATALSATPNARAHAAASALHANASVGRSLLRLWERQAH